MSSSTVPRSRPGVGTPLLPRSLPRPVTAVLTTGADDQAVLEAAVRLAATRREPVLLVALLADRASHPLHADGHAARLALARALPLLRRTGLGYIPVLHRVPPSVSRRPRLRTAHEVLEVAERHHSPLIVASGRAPAGMDAHSLEEASRPRGGPLVHAATPACLVTARPGTAPGPLGLTPAAVRAVWARVDRHITPPAPPAASPMDGPTGRGRR